MLNSTNLWNYINLTVSLFFGVISTLGGIYTIPQARPDIPTTDLLFGLLASGLGAATLHGVLWTRIETTFGSEFGSGGGATLPTGRDAAILSVTITVPLLIDPPLAHFSMRAFIDPNSYYILIPQLHYVAFLPVVAAFVGRHFLLYGIPNL